MSWPTVWWPPWHYPQGTGQILGLVGCIAWFIQLLGQTIYIFHRHTHRRSSSERILKFIPPAQFAFYRAYAGVLLALSNLGGNMLGWNIALVAQPHLLILFGLFEWASRHGMDGAHKVIATIWILLVLSAVEVGVLYIVSDVPIVLFVICGPVLITLVGAVLGLWERIKEKDGADRPCVALMVLGVLGGSTSIVAVVYTPWISLQFAYTSLAVYSIDTLLWLCALLGAWYVKWHSKPLNQNPFDQEAMQDADLIVR